MTCPGESGINGVSWREAKNCPVLAKGKEMACPGEGKAIDGSCRGAKICPVLAKVKKLSCPGQSQKKKWRILAESCHVESQGNAVSWWGAEKSPVLARKKRDVLSG